MQEFLLTSWSEPRNFLLLSGLLFAIIFLRYMLVSGVYHYLLYVVLGGTFSRRRLHGKAWQPGQARLEIFRSAYTSLIFAVSGVVLVILWQRGYTNIYLDWSAYPWYYHPVSLLLALFIQETYYYWLHRWMHWPKVFRIVHKWHHDSMDTSSFTSFSFHPIESILQAIVVPVLVLFLPMHLYVLFFLLLLMTLSGTINHAAIEIYPTWFKDHWIGKWLIGATHHDLHHRQYRFNFGLYFTFWDRWMGTESPDYEKWFVQKVTEDPKGGSQSA